MSARNESMKNETMKMRHGIKAHTPYSGKIRPPFFLPLPPSTVTFVLVPLIFGTVTVKLKMLLLEIITFIAITRTCQTKESDTPTINFFISFFFFLKKTLT